MARNEAMDMRIDEVAAYIGKSVYQVRRYMEAGVLPFHKVEKRLYFHRADVEAFAQARRLRVSEQAMTRPVEMTDEITYIGDDQDMWCETRIVETWADIHEWIDSINAYMIQQITLFYGPGSMITVHMLFVRHNPMHGVDTYPKNLVTPIEPSSYPRWLEEDRHG